MGETGKASSRSINPWVLHLQKLGLELKCPLCLSFLKRPTLLPCDHIFCICCLPSAKLSGSGCPLCKAQYVDQDLRPLPFIENMVAIYRSLDAAFSASVFQSTSSGAESGRISKESVKGALEDNSCSGQSGILLTVDKMDQVLQSHSVKVEVGRNAVMDVDQVVQLSPGSPPSFGDVRVSENEMGGQGDAVESFQKYVPAILGKRRAVGVTRQESHDYSSSGTDSKRHKKLECRPINMCSDIVVSKAAGTCSQPSVVLGTCIQPPKMLSESSAIKAVCGFCQSSRISEVTGPMLHYINGKPVEGDKATLSNVIHVHKMCIEWTPKTYFVGETVKNLNAELARGAKLKCGRCGLKGAALGCFVKSCRRSYHFPCAMEIINCRWDHDDFLVLCPAHSSHKFPNEKSSTEKHSLRHRSAPTKIAPQQSKFWEGSSGVKEWVFCGSGLSSEEKGLLAEFGSMIGVPVTKFWKPNVTHVIASIDSSGACTRTLKVLMATLNGRWVLTIDWIKACMQSMRPVDEEQYEVSLDNHGCVGGPRTGRLRASRNAPKLFHGLSFYFVGDFVDGYKEDLLNLVRTAGGVILESEENLVELNHDQATPKTLIVYNLDPAEGCKLGEEVTTIWQRLSDAEDLAAKFGSQVIAHTWLLESIAAYKLRPFVRCNSGCKGDNFVV